MLYGLLFGYLLGLEEEQRTQEPLPPKVDYPSVAEDVRAAEFASTEHEHLRRIRGHW